MSNFTAKQKKQLGKRICQLKSQMFSGRGSGNRLASHLGVAPQLLSHWISGTREPSQSQLYEIAKLCGISIQELCVLPKVKIRRDRKAGLNLIIEITNLRKTVSNKSGSRAKEERVLQSIKDIMQKELGNFTSRKRDKY